MARMLVLHLHDRCERIRLFEKLKLAKDATGFQGEALKLKELLRNDPFFQSFEVKRQKEILNGSRASILTLSEMEDRYASDNDTWTIYQFLSHYAHSHPVSFMRNDDRRRDGLPNDTDKMYITGILRWIASSIEGAIEAYRQIPSGLPE